MTEIDSQSAATKIDKDMFESYLHCRCKAYLKLTQQLGAKSDYETLLTELRAEVKLNTTNKILAQYPEHDVAQDISMATFLLKRGPLYVFNAILEDDLLSLRFDGLRRMSGASKLGDFHYIPMLFHAGRQVGKQQKLLLELYSLFLSKIQGRLSDSGIIWHGKECKATKVRLNPNLSKIELLLQDLMEIGRSKSPPRLILGDHCQICEYHHRCHTQAVQEDNISLLKGIGVKEIKRLNRRGIFTVTQLSCTFLPRKKRKRANPHKTTRYFALQAMAIRDSKIYVFGTPHLPVAPTRIYVDLEGDPDRTFAYLLGVIIDDRGIEKQYHFWVNNQCEERLILQRFIRLIAPYTHFKVFYYGSYEAAFFRRMRKQSTHKKLVDKIISNSFNIPDSCIKY